MSLPLSLLPLGEWCLRFRRANHMAVWQSRTTALLQVDVVPTAGDDEKTITEFGGAALAARLGIMQNEATEELNK